MADTNASASSAVWFRERESVKRQSAPPAASPRSKPSVTAEIMSERENWGQWVGFKIASA